MRDHVPNSSAHIGSTPEDEAECDGGGKGGDEHNAVSLLQEDIQRHSQFSPHAKILTWTFQKRLQQDELLQFQAVVSFVFGEVPHHYCGDWQSSKKKAQRDTAERVRRYLERSRAPKPDEEQAQGGTGAGTPARSAVDAASLPEGLVEQLRAVVEGFQQSGGGGPAALEWHLEASSAPEGLGEKLKATVTFYIHGLPHCFCGAWCADEGAARRDTAERVLWYFHQSEQTFAAPERAALEGSPPPPMVPPPPTSPARGSSSSSPRAAAQQQQQQGSNPAAGPPAAPDGGGVPAAEAQAGPSVEDRTILMQVQNQLQKLLAKETPQGSKVWIWSYDAHPCDPQIFRARVQIAALRLACEGDWCRGKKLAQRSACLEVRGALDKLGEGR